MHLKESDVTHSTFYNSNILHGSHNGMMVNIEKLADYTVLFGTTHWTYIAYFIITKTKNHYQKLASTFIPHKKNS